MLHVIAMKQNIIQGADRRENQISMSEILTYLMGIQSDPEFSIVRLTFKIP